MGYRAGGDPVSGVDVLAVMQDATDAASDSRADDLHGIVCGDVYADARAAVAELIAAANVALELTAKAGEPLPFDQWDALRVALAAVQP